MLVIYKMYTLNYIEAVRLLRLENVKSEALELINKWTQNNMIDIKTFARLEDWIAQKFG